MTVASAANRWSLFALEKQLLCTMSATVAVSRTSSKVLVSSAVQQQDLTTCMATVKAHDLTGLSAEHAV